MGPVWLRPFDNGTTISMAQQVRTTMTMTSMNTVARMAMEKMAMTSTSIRTTTKTTTTELQALLTVHQPSVRFFLPTKEVSIKSIYALTKLILLSSSEVLLLLVHSTWGTDRSNEPRRPCPGVPLLPAKPNFHPTSPPPSLPNHRNRREDIRFPLRNRSLLCAKQSIWDWWSLPRDHPVYSALANGPRHCPSAGLHRVEHWVGCTGNEGLRGCASSPIFFI